VRCAIHPIIDNHRGQIAAVCRKHGVLRLEVFGSVLRSDYDEASSDVDVVVEFDAQAPGSALRRYFDLKAGLEAVLNRPVDIIVLDAMDDTRLKRIIERTKVPVYAAAA
jgi:predicted nucleotidyltransferase